MLASYRPYEGCWTTSGPTLAGFSKFCSTAGTPKIPIPAEAWAHTEKPIVSGGGVDHVLLSCLNGIRKTKGSDYGGFVGRESEAWNQQLTIGFRQGSGQTPATLQVPLPCPPVPCKNWSHQLCPLTHYHSCFKTMETWSHVYCANSILKTQCVICVMCITKKKKQS